MVGYTDMLGSLNETITRVIIPNTNTNNKFA